MADADTTRFDNIMQKLDDAWQTWLTAVTQADSSSDETIALMRETAEGDERAVEVIRGLVEQNTYQQLPGADSVGTVDTLDDAREAMNLHHERLLGALETVAETAEDVVSAVESRIGPLTWDQYSARAARIGSSGDAST